MSVFGPHLKPAWTIPPFRVLAPQPSVSASISVTRAPWIASCLAAATPVRPPPMTTTSAVSGSARALRSGKTGIVACQNERRWSPASGPGGAVIPRGQTAPRSS
jgi:hypothetical protein